MTTSMDDVLTAIGDLKDHVDHRIDRLRSEVKADLADQSRQLRAEFKADLAEQSKQLRAEFKADLAELRSEFKADLAEQSDRLKIELMEFTRKRVEELRTELKTEIDELRTEMRRLHKQFLAAIENINERLEGLEKVSDVSEMKGRIEEHSRMLQLVMAGRMNRPAAG